MSKNPHAVALGRKGGRVTSEAKAAAARANGKKGGRPKQVGVRMHTRIIRLTSVALLAVMLAAGAASAGQLGRPDYPPVRETLTQPEKDQYLAAMRIGWVEVDANSDAKPAAICFQDHLARTTPLTAAPSRETTQVILRFESLPRGIVVTVLLLNDEALWQGWVTPNPNYAGAADPSCQFADTLAGQLRARIRQAKANLW